AALTLASTSPLRAFSGVRAGFAVVVVAVVVVPAFVDPAPAATAAPASPTAARAITPTQVLQSFFVMSVLCSLLSRRTTSCEPGNDVRNIGEMHDSQQTHRHDFGERLLLRRRRVVLLVGDVLAPGG